MFHGVINIYKEPGFTSHDVVAKLRGILRQKKIGHTGTLDPAAEGVLPVCLGKGTKLCDLLTDKRKTYQAVLLLGTETDTQDMTGTILSEKPTEQLTEPAVRGAAESFVGPYMQVPPMYSALKVNGKKLYELARAGKEVERAARPVEIYDLQIDAVELPRVTMTVTCSKGTYIRTLCYDIGRKLGCGGCLGIGLGRIVCCLCRVLVRGSGGHAVRAGCTSGCLGASGCCAGAISLFCRDCVGRSHRLRAGTLSISTLAV